MSLWGCILRQCIDCYHLSEPFHVYGGNHEHPHRTWLQTWHWKDEQHGDGPYYYFSEARFMPELYRYIFGGRKLRNKQIKHMAKYRGEYTDDK